MAAIKLLNLFAVISLALFASSFNVPVNALAHGHEHRHLNRQIAHEGVARRSTKRSTKRCKPKNSSVSSLAPVPTSASHTSSPAPPVKTSSAAPAPEKTPEPSPSSKPAATPKPSPSPAPAPPPSSSGGGGNPGSVGIGWNGGNDKSLALLAGGNAKVVYDWSPFKMTNTFGLDFAPMLWGDGSKVSQFQSNFPADSQFIFGFNEPDISSQSNMDPNAAAGLYRSTITPKKKPGVQLISPAPTGQASGVQWLQTFLSACSDCQIDVVAIHMYETDPQKVISFVTDLHQKTGKNVWITEVACQNFGGSGGQCSMDQTWNFHQTIMKWAVNTPWMGPVFPFGFLQDMSGVNPTNQLLKDGQLTDLGSWYIHGNFNA